MRKKPKDRRNHSVQSPADPKGDVEVKWSDDRRTIAFGILAGALGAVAANFNFKSYNSLALFFGLLAIVAFFLAAVFVLPAGRRWYLFWTATLVTVAVFTWLLYQSLKGDAIQNATTPVTIITSERSPLSSPTSAPIAAPRQSNAAERAHEQIKQAPATFITKLANMPSSAQLILPKRVRL